MERYACKNCESDIRDVGIIRTFTHPEVDVITVNDNSHCKLNLGNNPFLSTQVNKINYYCNHCYTKLDFEIAQSVLFRSVLKNK